MLEILLKHIRGGGTFEVERLAAQLGTTPRLVQAMLEHLAQRGLIQDYTFCGDGCSGCGLAKECRPGEKGRSVRLYQAGG